MKCPHCGNIDDKVLETRYIAEGSSICRRRECSKCGYRFTSYEHIEEKILMLIKKDGRREEFSRSKLQTGIQKAVEKRPVSQLDIENLLNEIEDEASLKSKDGHEIPSSEIGEMVMKKLHNLDQVAYVRFASVYRKFEDVEEFIIEVKNLKWK